MLLHHLTFNTGHVAETQRSAVNQQVIDHLLPLIDNGGGPVPSMRGYHLSFFVPRLPSTGARTDEGYGFFQIAADPGLSQRPLIVAWTAWKPTQAWSLACLGNEGLKPSLQKIGFWRDPPKQEPRLPWLAVCLTPYVVLPIPVPAADLMAFGDLERCVTWAMMESE
jgi:hypothetical protein